MAEQKKPTILRFRLALPRPMDAFDIFYPKGHHALNRTKWRGKEPRSCAVTGLRSHPQFADDIGPTVFDVEVSYRPKGYITFLGNTKYDGWTAMMLDKKKDGTLLDGQGNALPPGQPPVYLPFEVYEDAEFNEMDFGEFIEEVEIGGIAHVSRDDVMQRTRTARRFGGTMDAGFVAPRRQRPQAKIVVTDLQLQSAGESKGMRTIFVDKTAPHFKQTLFDQLYEVASGYVEGRYSIKTLSTEDFMFVEFSDAIMELKHNSADPKNLESLFDVFATYCSPEDMEEMAKRLMAVYEVDITIVDGNEGGFLIRRTNKKEE
jgi:hypothetical protein